MSDCSSPSAKVLFIGPHPDDVFISCAGFLIKNVENYNFDVVCMTSKNIKPSSDVRIEEERSAWAEISNITGA